LIDENAAFMGIGQDFNATNFCLRWSLPVTGAWPKLGPRDSPETAKFIEQLKTLPLRVAQPYWVRSAASSSRTAREFRRRPSHTFSSEDRPWKRPRIAAARSIWLCRCHRHDRRYQNQLANQELRPYAKMARAGLLRRRRQSIGEERLPSFSKESATPSATNRASIVRSRVSALLRAGRLIQIRPTRPPMSGR
jgi:hypothetical protein